MTLTANDIKRGRVYSAKRPVGSGFPPLLNDRQVMHVDALGNVQYDSPTVANGRHYPKVAMDKFLKWAKEDITEQMPAGTWRSA